MADRDGVTGSARGCGSRRVEDARPQSGGMSVALRILDDGAWISANDQREVSVSELWRFGDADWCACRLPDLVVEGFLEVGVDGRTVETRVYGQCIACGEKGTTDWLPVGRVIDGEFVDVDRQSVLRPVDRSARPPAAGADSTDEAGTP